MVPARLLDLPVELLPYLVAGEGAPALPFTLLLLLSAGQQLTQPVQVTTVIE